MEVTPLDFRGVLVSSGEGLGATPHGRDTSPPTTSSATNDPYSIEQIRRNAPEKYPINVVSQRVAKNLMQIIPGLNAEDAKHIADRRTAPDPEPEPSKASTPDTTPTTGATVDVSA